MLNVVKVQRGVASTSVVFEVPVINGPVYMRAVVPHGMQDKRALVFVNAEKFRKLWANEPYSIHQEQALGSPATWPYDRKFGQAQKGFSQGADNAVPLAYVHARAELKNVPIVKKYFGLFTRTVGFEKRALPYVCFTDGVTRTIWLLNYGAPVFPVMVDQTEAKALYQFCGEGGGPVPFTHLLTQQAA